MDVGGEGDEVGVGGGHVGAGVGGVEQLGAGHELCVGGRGDLARAGVHDGDAAVDVLAGGCGGVELAAGEDGDIMSEYYPLKKARKLVEKQTGILFEIVRAVGVKKIQAGELRAVGAGYIRAVRRKAKSGAERIGLAKYNDLSVAEKNTIIAQRAQLMAIAHIADNRRTSRVEAAAANGGAPDAGRVLEMMAKR